MFNITYALKEGNLVSIADVENGLKCNCVCPACKKALIAKNHGKKKTPHFAHHPGGECAYGYQTSLHLMAKSIIEKAKKIVIPAVYISNQCRSFPLIPEPKEIPIDKVVLEYKFDDIIPDVVVYSGDKTLFVEIFVTHRVDKNKLEKLKQKDISTIEVDLSKEKSTIFEDELTEILLNDNSKKQWLYNSYANKWYHKFVQECEEKELLPWDFKLQVDKCPFLRRLHPSSKSLVNVETNCINCSYFFNLSDSSLFCLGNSGIASVQDFEIPLEERRKKNDNKEKKSANYENYENRRKMIDALKNKGQRERALTYERMMKIEGTSLLEKPCPWCGGKVIELDKKGNFECTSCEYKTRKITDWRETLNWKERKKLLK